MATLLNKWFTPSTNQAPTQPRWLDGAAFDKWFVFCTSLFIMGVFLDGWAHSNGRTDNTFFTPWHAVLYSGTFTSLGFMLASVFINWGRGYRGWQLVPAGYELSLFGLTMFAVGGGADMVWHTLLGVETNFEAQISPPHLFLNTMLGLLMAGPVRAAWRRKGLVPANAVLVVLSLSYTVASLWLLTLYAHPFMHLRALEATQTAQEFGVTGMLLHTAVLMGVILLVSRRWQLPVGSFTAFLTLTAVGIAVISGRVEFIPVAALTGLAADLYTQRWQPGRVGGPAWRIFAFGLPFLLFTLYFAVIALIGHIAWVAHVWMGSIVMAGLTGWLVSYLVWPPEEFEL